MDLFKINIKIPAIGDVADSEIVPIFHRWIQQQSLPNHLLIDVANYEHVHNGPGVVVIASEANIHLDHSDGQAGLLYVRKRPIAAAATLEQRLLQVINTALAAAAKLSQEPELVGRLVFKTSEIGITCNDRLAAPNRAESFERIRPAVESAAAQLDHGGAAVVERVQNSPLELLKLRLLLPSGRSAELMAAVADG